MNLMCGKCQNWYEMIPNIIGQPDLEGIEILIEGRLIKGTDINICQKCAIKALSGTSGFKRTGNIVKI